MIQSMQKRLSSLTYLVRPLLLTFIGLFFLEAGITLWLITYFSSSENPILQALTLSFLDPGLRSVLLIGLGILVFWLGLWQLGGVIVLPRSSDAVDSLVVGMRTMQSTPRLVVFAGGSGMLVLAGIGEWAGRMTCITPVQDQVEYYYRASNLVGTQNVVYFPPTPLPARAIVQLDDGSRHNVKQVVHDLRLSERHVEHMVLSSGDTRTNDTFENATDLPAATAALEAVANASAIIFGPGGLFDSVLPNLLIPQIAEAIRQSPARKVYICNLMTEPGLTNGFTVADHIRQIRQYGGFTPDFVLVNAQRIEPEVRQIYEAAQYRPVYLTPEEYEETVVLDSTQQKTRELLVEGAVVIEADLVSTVVQVTASVANPGETRAARVLRHDPEKLAAALKHILQRAA